MAVELGGGGGVWSASSLGRTGTYLRIVVFGGGGGHVELETARVGYVVLYEE